MGIKSILVLTLLLISFIACCGFASAAVDDSNTKILLHMDGANAGTVFTDESGKTWTVGGNAQFSTNSPKFGTASGLFNNSSVHVQRPSAVNLI